MSPKEQISGEKDIGEVRQQREWRQKPNQATAENEHVVVRGTDKGKTITRTIIATPDDSLEADNITFMEEHHNDPPQDDDHDDATMMDLEEDNGDAELQGGLSPGERAAF